jgi:hypothetical protein
MRELCRIIRHLGSGINSIQQASPLFEIVRLLVPLDHVASLIVDANHSIPQATEWQHIGDQINAAAACLADIADRLATS